MTGTKLGTALDRVTKRRRQYRTCLATGVATSLVILGCAWVQFAPATLRPPLPSGGEILLWTIGVEFLLVMAGLIWANRPFDDATRRTRTTARGIETLFPDLDGKLLAAVDEEAKVKAGQVVRFLPATVIREALEHRQRHYWEAVVPGWRLLGARLYSWTAYLLLAGLAISLAIEAPPAVGPRPLAAVVEGTASPADVQVDPGDAEVERGTPLLVVARFKNNVPANARLEVDAAEPATPRPMARSLEDPTFAGRIESVDRELGYRVAFDGGTSPTYRVKVFTYPAVRRVDALLNYPSYTGLASKTAEDVRHVTAVEGTDLHLSVRLNKEVAQARLVDETGAAIPLTLADGPAPANKDGEPEPVYTAAWTLADPHKYRIELTDRDGRKNKTPTELNVNVTRNRPATVVLAAPAKDVRVSPVEEVRLQARTEDDFGVVAHGIQYVTPGGEPVDLTLDPGTPAAKKRLADHLIALEALKAQPDQLVSYHFWADDIGPDGKPRRTQGDLFFAEVRHFEEVFRQGEPPPSGSEQEKQEQQQAGQQAQQLAEAQKQIIAATWTLVRRETAADVSPQFALDATAVREAQSQAIEQAEPMLAKIPDAQAKAALEAALKQMRAAEKLLTDAVNGEDARPLQPALAAEQAAYQALLKLRARETEVSRQRRQQGGGGGSASQQQLNELELSDDENRYEQQQAAQSKQQATKAEAEKRETRQILNRLAELARRQADLNERLKELQAALEAAKTPEAKAEAERQLKRLRDQQEQVLRDTDEARERMEREENRDRMADARQRIDRGREQVRQAAEALEAGQVGQAINQGARAERELNDLRDDLRKQSADRFREDVGQMRSQARKLADEQDKLSDQLKAWDEQSKRSLRDPDAKRDVGEKLAEQKKGLDGLLDGMKKTVEQAEESEPLLAKELFDAVQKAGQKGIPKDLDEADQLARAGLPDEAARSSRQAAESLGGLRDGVERAARGILGDEAEALKRAQSELEDLSNQANRGLARNDDPNARRAARPGTDPADRRPGGESPKPETAIDPDGRPAEPGQRPGPDQGANPGQQLVAGEGPGAGERRQPGQGQDAANQSPGQQPGQGQQPGRGDQPGEGQGQQPRDAQGQGQGQQPGQGQGRRPNPGQGQQPGQGQGQGNQPGQGQGQGNQPGQPGQGQQPGQGGQGQQPGQGGQQPGQDGRGGQGGQGQAGGGGNPSGNLDRLMEGFAPAEDGAQPQAGGQGGPGGNNRGGGTNTGGGANRGGEEVNPITGAEGFRQWSDRLRDVEELLDDPDLRAEAARIRDRARGARDEARRHAAPLDPAKLKEMVAEPIEELSRRVAEEVRRRESPDALVPIDRDPVPPRFTDGVRRYYERLGSGR